MAAVAAQHMHILLLTACKGHIMVLDIWAGTQPTGHVETCYIGSWGNHRTDPSLAREGGGNSHKLGRSGEAVVLRTQKTGILQAQSQQDTKAVGESQHMNSSKGNACNEAYIRNKKLATHRHGVGKVVTQVLNGTLQDTRR